MASLTVFNLANPIEAKNILQLPFFLIDLQGLSRLVKRFALTCRVPLVTVPEYSCHPQSFSHLLHLLHLPHPLNLLHLLHLLHLLQLLHLLHLLLHLHLLPILSCAPVSPAPGTAKAMSSSCAIFTKVASPGQLADPLPPLHPQ